MPALFVCVYTCACTCVCMGLYTCVCDDHYHSSSLSISLRNYLESENDLMTSFIYIQELRLYFSALIANIITSLPKGPDRLRLFVPEIRYNLFYLFANWCGLFGLLVRETEPETRLKKLLPFLLQIEYYSTGISEYKITIPS